MRRRSEVDQDCQLEPAGEAEGHGDQDSGGLHRGLGHLEMSDPRVSIIIRSFNEGWALSDTLRALVTQDYWNWELIVIDSGSTDGSVELIRRANPRLFIQILPE